MKIDHKFSEIWFITINAPSNIMVTYISKIYFIYEVIKYNIALILECWKYLLFGILNFYKK